MMQFMSTYIHPKQCRAARGLLGIPRKDLAAASSVSVQTIAGFERGGRVPIRNNSAAIRAALEAAGVEFIPGGVRLRSDEDEAPA